MFDLDDYSQLITYLQPVDPKLHDLCIKYGYLEPIPERNLFSTLVGAIIGQRIKFARARQIRRNLYLTLGNDNFTPDQIIKIGVDKLLATGMSKNIADTILRLSLGITSKTITLNTISDVQELKVKGIGPWTIGCTIVMYSLHHTDQNFHLGIFNDLIIKRGMKSLYGSEDSNISQNWIQHELVFQDGKYHLQVSDWRPIIIWYIWKAYT